VPLHSVSPRLSEGAAARRHGYEKSEINEIANMAFIAGRTNQKSRTPPAAYRPRIIDSRGENALTAQQVAMDRELWTVENHRAFLRERRTTLAAAVSAFIQDASEIGSVERMDSVAR
jgi:hypothetical protein